MSDSLGKIVSINSAVALLIGTSYLFGYSIVLGINLFNYFYIEDYIHVVIDIIPLMTALIGLLLLIKGDKYLKEFWIYLPRLLVSTPIFFGIVGVLVSANIFYFSKSPCISHIDINDKQSIQGKVLFALSKHLIIQEEDKTIIIMPNDNLLISQKCAWN
ncbi:MAG: hypothetical protein EPN17_07390 [Methylobacter sp.]|nr:MAG: hypothetical protein EPN17_07390 [Methylobacter sp.]